MARVNITHREQNSREVKPRVRENIFRNPSSFLQVEVIVSLRMVTGGFVDGFLLVLIQLSICPNSSTVRRCELSGRIPLNDPDVVHETQPFRYSDSWCSFSNVTSAERAVKSPS
jgi:hypothetical protein